MKTSPSLDLLIKEYSDYIDAVNLEAYRHLYFISNPTLSKNPYSGSNLLRNYLAKNKISLNTLSYVKSLFLFYSKNALYFLSYLTSFVFNFLYLKKNNNFEQKNIILVDTFIGPHQFNKEGKLEDRFFHKLYEILEKKKIPYILLPNIYGTGLNPIHTIQILKNLKSIDQKYLTEFELLKLTDLLHIAKYILTYPIHLLNNQKKLKRRNTELDHYLEVDLCHTLGQTTFHSFAKYLYGKRLKTFFSNKSVKIISWNENQPIDKYLYKGIRSANTHIYGCQFFIKYPICQSHYLSDSENIFGTYPDTILVNGSYFIPKESKLHYLVGPALRYHKIFNEAAIVKINSAQKFLVMLSYMEDENEIILNYFLEAKKLKNISIDFKLHPDNYHLISKYKDRISSRLWSVLTTAPDPLDYAVMATAGSGTSLEFATKGVSVIILFSQDPIKTNPMPYKGKGIIWQSAECALELEQAYNDLLEKRVSAQAEIVELASFYRTQFFSSVTEQDIIQKFNLEDVYA